MFIIATSQRTDMVRQNIITSDAVWEERRSRENSWLHPAGCIIRVIKIMRRRKTTQCTGGVAVTAVTNCCVKYVETSRPQQWGPDLALFGKAGHAEPHKTGNNETNPDHKYHTDGRQAQHTKGQDA